MSVFPSYRWASWGSQKCSQWSYLKTNIGCQKSVGWPKRVTSWYGAQTFPKATPWGWMRLRVGGEFRMEELKSKVWRTQAFIPLYPHHSYSVFVLLDANNLLDWNSQVICMGWVFSAFQVRIIDLCLLLWSGFSLLKSLQPFPIDEHRRVLPSVSVPSSLPPQWPSGFPFWHTNLSMLLL